MQPKIVLALLLLLKNADGKQKGKKTTKLPVKSILNGQFASPVYNTTLDVVPSIRPPKGSRVFPPPSVGPPTNLESPCKEENVIFVESSIPVSGVTECQTLCIVAESCTFFTFNSGNCGIRSYSPSAYITASPFQNVGTKTEIFSPLLDGKVFVGQALQISGGKSLDCQISCQRDYNCISWTWNEVGGLNPEICVHNYGRTQRKLAVPAIYNIVSGPKYCKIVPRYQCCTVSFWDGCEQRDAQTNYPVTCDDIAVNHLKSSGGIANIYPQGISKEVLCDALTDVENCVTGRGPWTVIQRRGQFGNPDDFFSAKLWDDYVEGFGIPNKEYWLGLKDMAIITAVGQWELRVDLEDYAGKQYSAIYNNFQIARNGLYRLTLTGYDAARSTVADSLSYHSGSDFSTSDNDNDNYSGNCASRSRGAWWHNKCHNSNLNGYNYFQGDLPETSLYFANGIIWENQASQPDQDYYYSWPRVEMKIRKVY